MLALPDHRFVFGQPRAAVRRLDLQVGETHRVVVVPGDIDAIFAAMQRIAFGQRHAEIGDAHQRRAPVGNGADVVDEPFERGMHLVERADRHHQSTEGDVAGEIDGRRHQDRRDHGDPAIGIGHPGQVDLRGVDAHHRLQRFAEVEIEPLLLVRLAARQRDGVDMVVDAHHRVPQLRFARVAVAVELDQRPAHRPADQRGETRIEEGRPDHVAGDGEGMAADMEDEAGRQ